jgi:hypothetical protein
MGTKVAPTYATLILGFLEEKLFSETEQHFGENFGQYIRYNWKRFLDDCLIFCTKSLSELHQLHDLDVSAQLSPTNSGETIDCQN